MKDSKLVITIKNKKDIPLTDLTISLLNLSCQYKEFCRREGFSEVDNGHLYIKEFKTGSLIVELKNNIEPLLPIFTDVNTIVAFTYFIQNSFLFLQGKISKPPTDFTKSDLTQLSKSVLVTSNDSHDSTISFTAHEGSNQVVNYTMNKIEVSASQNEMSKLLEKIKEPSNNIVEKVMMVWFQARFNDNNKTGSKAIINSILPNIPVNVIFEDETTKTKMMEDSNGFNQPWHKLAYIVDVDVAYVGDDPKLYKITKCYFDETFEL